MMQFIYQFDEFSPKVSIELGADAAIPEALEAFESFLKAAGYSIPEGHIIDIIPEDPTNTEGVN